MRLLLNAILILVLCFGAFACQKAYYSAMEQAGVHKREILADRVDNARDAQQDVKEQFASALDRFRSVVNVDGGELEERYELLKMDYERSEDKAKALRDRIDSVEDVAEALFEEWERELEQYSSDTLRRNSQEQYAATKRRYVTMINAMRRAERSVPPVLAAFRDQVLYLKHNLNARAVASLQGELDSVQAEVEGLITTMERSIAESESFLATLEGTES